MDDPLSFLFWARAALHPDFGRWPPEVTRGQCLITASVTGDPSGEGCLLMRQQQQFFKMPESASRSVVSNSLRPRGLYSPWNSPGQNTGVGSLSLLHGIFPSQGSNTGLPTAGGFFTSWAPGILEWVAYPFSSRSSQPGIELGSPALLADSLPTELWRKPKMARRNNIQVYHWEEYPLHHFTWVTEKNSFFSFY